MAVSASPSQVSFGTCNVEWKRQNVFHSTEKTVSKTSKDPLPIVELKPFVKKVWRREKSLPGFYDRHCVAVPVLEELENKPDQPSPSPQPQLLQNRGEDKITSASAVRLGVRPTTRHHPSADSKHPKQVEHSQSILPGFITRSERTKSTLTEIQEGESMSRIFSCRKQVLKPRDVERQRSIRLCGDHMRQTISKKRLTYLNPFSNFTSLLSSWESIHKQKQFLACGQHGFSYSAPEMRSRVKYVYDEFDRHGTLPSIHIENEKLQKRETRNKECNLTFDVHSEGNARKVGGIKNSLDVLSKVGQPTQIERQITLQLETNLSKYKKSRDYFPIDITPSELAKYYTPSNVNLTKGEKMLRQGQELNTSRSRRQGVNKDSDSDLREERLSHKDTMSEPIIANRVLITKGFEGLKQRYTSFENMRDRAAYLNTPRSDMEDMNAMSDRRLRFADDLPDSYYNDDMPRYGTAPAETTAFRDDVSFSTTTSTPKDFAMIQSVSEVEDNVEEEHEEVSAKDMDTENVVDNGKVEPSTTFITESNKDIMVDTTDLENSTTELARDS